MVPKCLPAKPVPQGPTEPPTPWIRLPPLANPTLTLNLNPQGVNFSPARLTRHETLDVVIDFSGPVGVSWNALLRGWVYYCRRSDFVAGAPATSGPHASPAASAAATAVRVCPARGQQRQS